MRHDREWGFITWLLLIIIAAFVTALVLSGTGSQTEDAPELVTLEDSVHYYEDGF